MADETYTMYDVRIWDKKTGVVHFDDHVSGVSARVVELEQVRALDNEIDLTNVQVVVLPLSTV